MKISRQNGNQGLRVLFLCSPVAPLQHGATGGVKHSILSSYQALSLLGHDVTLLAPAGTAVAGLENVIEIAGATQAPVQEGCGAGTYPIFADSFLANAVDYVKAHQKEYDLVINFANDWLPYYMTDFLSVPIIHIPNLGHVNDALSDVMRKTALRHPRRVACLTHAQAEDLGLKNYEIIGHSLDVANVPFDAAERERGFLCYFGRIVPEKGVAEAAFVARSVGMRLKVMGYIQDRNYFEKLMREYGDTIDYRGYLKHDEIVNELQNCLCVLHLHTWREAFGLVLIESFACGVPVIASALGGPQEIVEHGRTGFLVEPGDTVQAIRAVKNISTLNRSDVRETAETRYSLQALAESYRRWFEKLGFDGEQRKKAWAREWENVSYSRTVAPSGISEFKIGGVAAFSRAM